MLTLTKQNLQGLSHENEGKYKSKSSFQGLISRPSSNFNFIQGTLYNLKKEDPAYVCTAWQFQMVSTILDAANIVRQGISYQGTS